MKYKCLYEGVGKARLYDIDASYKDLTQVCAGIRGKKVSDAVDFLESVSKGEKPVLYKKFNKRLGHRRELGGKKGRYPKKSAKIVLEVLKNAIANAIFNGFDENNLFVVSAVANKQRILSRVAPRGPRRRSDYVTACVQIVLDEMEEME